MRKQWLIVSMLVGTLGAGMVGAQDDSALAGLKAAVGDLRKAEAFAVEVRRLAGIAHPEFDVVDAFQFQWIFHWIAPHSTFYRR